MQVITTSLALRIVLLIQIYLSPTSKTCVEEAIKVYNRLPVQEWIDYKKNKDKDWLNKGAEMYRMSMQLCKAWATSQIINLSEVENEMMV